MNDPTKPGCSGIMTYVIVNGTVYIIKAVSFGRIRPVNEDSREYWTCMESISFHIVRICGFIYLLSL